MKQATFFETQTLARVYALLYPSGGNRQGLGVQENHRCIRSWWHKSCPALSFPLKLAAMYSPSVPFQGISLHCIPSLRTGRYNKPLRLACEFYSIATLKLRFARKIIIGCVYLQGDRSSCAAALSFTLRWRHTSRSL